MSTIDLTIDGVACTCEPGEYLWDVAKRNGIAIPALCRSDAFPDHKACCRVCIVEVEINGRSKVVTSCVYPVERACTVRTNSPKIAEERAVILALLAKRAPLSDVIAEMAADACAQIEAADDSQPEKGENPAALSLAGFDRLREIDESACILCGLCVEACNSLGTGAISTVNRGTDKQIDTPYSKASSACIGCVSCANVCPTNAISYRQDAHTRTIWNRTFERATCSRCGSPMGTVEALRHAGAEGDPLCDACRKKASADAMMTTYRLV